MPQSKTPDEIRKHACKYNSGAWRQYTMEELGTWVHLLHKRSQHRTDTARRDKDLADARNYWHMMGAWLDKAEGF